MKTELSGFQIAKKSLEEGVYHQDLHKELTLKDHVLVSASDGNFKVHKSFASIDSVYYTEHQLICSTFTLLKSFQFLSPETQN